MQVPRVYLSVRIDCCMGASMLAAKLLASCQTTCWLPNYWSVAKPSGTLSGAAPDVSCSTASALVRGSSCTLNLSGKVSITAAHCEGQDVSTCCVCRGTHLKQVT